MDITYITFSRVDYATVKGKSLSKFSFAAGLSLKAIEFGSPYQISTAAFFTSGFSDVNFVTFLVT